MNPIPNLSSIRAAAASRTQQDSKGANYSIYRLDLARMIKYINSNMPAEKETKAAEASKAKKITGANSRSNLDVLITKVVDIYNGKQKGKKDEEDEAPRTGAFRRLNRTNFTPSHNYQYIGYDCPTRGKTSATREAESTQGSSANLNESSSVSYIHFFYRTDPLREIAVLTTNMARYVIEKFVDYTFPRAVERLLDPKRITKVTRYSIIGKRERQILHLPSKEEIFSVRSLNYLVEGFEGDVKNDSKLHQLAIFPATKQKREIESSSEEDSDSSSSVDESSSSDEESLSSNSTDESSSIDDESRSSDSEEKTLEEGQLDPTARISIEVGASHFRVQRKIVLVKSPALLDLISRYSTEDAKTKGEGAADPLFNYLHILTPSPWDQREEFNRELVEMVRCAVQKEQEVTAEIRHKHFEDYVRAVDFQLKVGTRYKELKPETGGLPTLKAVVDLIENVDSEVVKKKADFYDAFAGARLRFRKDKDAKWKTAPLLNCLEGEVRDKEGNIHFKIKNVFYRLKAEFNALIKHDYDNLTDRTLVDLNSDDPAQLPHPWPSEVTPDVLKRVLKLERRLKALTTLRTKLEAEGILGTKKEAGRILKAGPLSDEIKNMDILKGKKLALLENFLEREFHYFKKIRREFDYNCLYLGKDDYHVFDTIEPPESIVEPFDVLKITDKIIFLFHVKKTFGNDTREVTSQIKCSAEEIRAALSLHQSTDYLKQLYQECTKDLSTCGAKKAFLEKVKAQIEKLGEKEFLSLFRNRKIVFVYACQEHGLQKERTLRRNVRVQELGEIFKSKSQKELQAIYDAIENANYIDQYGRLTNLFYSISNARVTMTTKSKGVKAKSFKLAGINDKDVRKIYTFLCEHYRTKLGSTIAKLELLHLERILRELGYDGFKICEIRTRVAETDMSLEDASEPSGDDNLSTTNKKKRKITPSDAEGSAKKKAKPTPASPKADDAPISPLVEDPLEAFQKQQKAILESEFDDSLDQVKEYLANFKKLELAGQVKSDAEHLKILGLFSPYVGLYNASTCSSKHLGRLDRNACWLNASVQACRSVPSLMGRLRALADGSDKRLLGLRTLLDEMETCDESKIRNAQKALYNQLISKKERDLQHDPDECFNKKMSGAIDDFCLFLNPHVPDQEEEVDYQGLVQGEIKVDDEAVHPLLVVTLERGNKDEGTGTQPADIAMARKALLAGGLDRAKAQREIDENIEEPSLTQSNAPIAMEDTLVCNEHTYRLRACIIHIGGKVAGNKAAGHYVAISRGVDNQWRYYNDHRVKSLKEEEWKEYAAKSYIQYWELEAEAKDKEEVEGSQAKSDADGEDVDEGVDVVEAAATGSQTEVKTEEDAGSHEHEEMLVDEGDDK